MIGQKRFDYFLNAVLYCLWSMNARHSKSRIRLYTWMSYLPKYFLNDRLRNKLDNRIQENLEMCNTLFYDKKKGVSIVNASRHFELASFFFVCIPLNLIYGCTVKWVGFNIYGFGVIFIIGSILSSKIFEKRVFKKDIYLKYFKRFDKEDYKWYRKWMLITFISIVVSFLIFILSFIFILYMVIHFDAEIGPLPPPRFSK